MITDRHLELIEKLKAKTLEKKTLWSKSSSQDEFQIQLSRISITIKYIRGSYNSVSTVNLSLYNDSGEKIDSVDFEDNSTTYDDAFELFNAVKRTYYKVDEVMDQLLNEIEGDDVIGLPF